MCLKTKQQRNANQYVNKNHYGKGIAIQKQTEGQGETIVGFSSSISIFEPKLADSNFKSGYLLSEIKTENETITTCIKEDQTLHTTALIVPSQTQSFNEIYQTGLFI